MVLLTPSPTLLSALRQYNSLPHAVPIPADPAPPYLDHQAIKKISTALIASAPHRASSYRLNRLLQGCEIYIPPKSPNPEPTDEYKALMASLRAQVEADSYRSLLDPADPTLASLRVKDMDEYTLTDLRSDLSLIANILFSVLATGGAVWAAASPWAVPERFALAFVSSIVVAVAEVVVLSGYYRRIEEAKRVERNKVEKKTVVKTWMVGGGGGMGDEVQGQI